MTGATIDQQPDVFGNSAVVQKHKQSTAVEEKQLLNEAEFLLRLNLELSTELEMNHLIQQVINAARHAVDAEFGVFFYNQAHQFKPGDGDAAPAVTADDDSGFAVPHNTNLFKSVIRGDGPVTMADALNDSRCADLSSAATPGQRRVRSCLATPVKTRDGAVLGGLFFGHTEVGKFTTDDQRLVIGIAQQAAIAMENTYARAQASKAELANVQLAAIVQSSDDAIISKDLDGIIQTWNPAAERMFGYTAADIIGKSITLLVPPERLDEELDILARLARGERIDHFETVRMRKDGARVDLWITVSPLFNSRGQIIGASNVTRDVSELRRVEREREQLLSSERFARQQAERSNRVKDEFLATLSHELRTPLNAILGWSHLLGSGKLAPDENIEAINTIQRNAHVQMQLIEDLLDVSRIISGKLRLDVRRIKLPPIIEAACEAVHPAAAAREIEIIRDIDFNAPAVTGDPARLQQIIWNLLSNAVKFTPHSGRVTICLRGSPSHLELSITDTGQGMAPEFLPNLFGRFQQADSSTTRRHGGLGLGLAIVKNLVELHGGSVRAASAGIDQGAAFTISIPIAPTSAGSDESPALNVATADAALMARLKHLRVLIVDDEPDARELIGRILRGFDAEVTTAGSAADAMNAISENQPDVLVSDIGMPEMDGYEFLRRLRLLPKERGGAIPAVALTAFARPEDRMRALLSGYQMHVSKPVEPSELLAVIASVASRPR